MNKIVKKSIGFLVLAIFSLTILFTLVSCSKQKHKVNIAKLTNRWEETENKKSSSEVKTSIHGRISDNDILELELSMKTQREFQGEKLTVTSEFSFPKFFVSGNFSTAISQLKSNDYINILKDTTRIEKSEHFKEFKNGLYVQIEKPIAKQDIEKIKLKVTVEVPDVTKNKVIIKNVKLEYNQAMDIKVKLGESSNVMTFHNFVEQKLKPIFEKELVIDENTADWEALEEFGILNADIKSYKDMSGYNILELDTDLDKKTGSIEKIENKQVKYIAKNTKKYLDEVISKVETILRTPAIATVLNEKIKTNDLNIDNIIDLMKGNKKEVKGISYEWGPEIKFNFELDKNYPSRIKNKEDIPKITKLSSLQNNTKIKVSKEEIKKGVIEGISSQINSPEKEEIIKRINEIFSRNDLILTVNSQTIESFNY